MTRSRPLAPASTAAALLPVDFRQVVEASLQGIAILDEDSIRYANAAFGHMFGHDSLAELVGQPWGHLVAAEDLPVVRARYAACAAGATDDGATIWQGNRRDGTTLWIESVAMPLPGDGRPATLMFLTDITQRRRLEDQFRQAQKMQAMGRLTGGVAHDFNNLLTVIMGYAEIMRTALAPEDPLANLLDEIHKAGERAALLTRQLLAFSRKRASQPVSTDLNSVLADMEKMLVRLIGEDVKLQLKTTHPLWKVKVDPGHIEQVVMNLAVNARDAMPQGGSLIIETANVELPDARMDYAATNPAEPFVMLAVSDTGCGMDAPIRAHLFEPFFTTKDPGKGTGLGLSTVHGIVKQSGGRIYVFSEPGLGSTFKIYLPRDTDHPSGDARTPPPPLRRGTETVLLVEDNAEVRGLARSVLARQGYTVLEAADGAEALAIGAAHRQPIDLLVSDVVLPKLGGGRLADQLRAHHGNLRVLFLSGYTDDAIVHHGVLAQTGALLQKPFLPDALAHKVREVLDA